MFNSKYSGQQVEELLDKVSGNTVTLNDFESAEYVVAESLVSLDKRVGLLEANSGSTGEAYDDTEIRALITTNAENIEALSGRTISYNDLTDKPEIPVLPEFKTINGETIIGTGDITISGGLTDEGYWDNPT